MSQYNSRLINPEEPSSSLHRIRSLLVLYMSVNREGAMVGAFPDGEIVLLDEVIAALEYVTAQVAELQRAARE